jgi:hypothetical protein
MVVKFVGFTERGRDSDHEDESSRPTLLVDQFMSENYIAVELECVWIFPVDRRNFCHAAIAVKFRGSA